MGKALRLIALVALCHILGGCISLARLNRPMRAQAAHLPDGAARVERYMSVLRTQLTEPRYAPYLGPNGHPVFCRPAKCTDGLVLGKSAQYTLAQRVLDAVEPGFTLDRIDPPELIDGQFPGIRSGKFILVASITCQ